MQTIEPQEHGISKTGQNRNQAFSDTGEFTVKTTMSERFFCNDSIQLRNFFVYVIPWGGNEVSNERFSENLNLYQVPLHLYSRLMNFALIRRESSPRGSNPPTIQPTEYIQLVPNVPITCDGNIWYLYIYNCSGMSFVRT